jgi:glycosyltransferase domain-containing protein
MLEDLTIVITTYKRYGYLKRLLSFLSLYSLKSKILILDSSPYYPDDAQLNKMLSKDGIQWLRFSDDIFFAHKIAEGCKHIETKYTVLCADDDFLVPNAIEVCVDYLDKNQDYTSAHGFYFSHHLVKENLFYIHTLFSTEVAISKDKSFDRIKSYLNGSLKYYPMYAVHRSDMFKLIWSETKKYVSDQGLSEIFPCCLSLLYGKMKVFPVFYSSREPNTFQWQDSAYDKWISKMYSDDKLSLAIKGLSIHLSDVCNLSAQESELLLRYELDAYVGRQHSEKHPFNRIFCSLFLKKIKNKIRVRTRLKMFMSRLLYRGCDPRIYKEYYNDYENIRKIVVSFNLTQKELNESRRELSSSK